MSETEIKGLLGKKLGMTQIFDENNHVVPVTVVEAGPCVITQIRTQETDGYTAIQIAYGDIDPRKVKKPQAGHFNKAGVTPRRHVAEIRMDDVSGYEPTVVLVALVLALPRVVCSKASAWLAAWVRIASLPRT